MIIDLQEFSFKKLNEDFIIKSLNENFRIAHSKKGARYPKPIILHKNINVDEPFSELIGLYIGDGDFNAKESPHVSFINIDQDVIIFVYKMFKEIFGLTQDKMTFMVNYSLGDTNKLKEKWSELLNITQDIKLHKSIRNRNEAFLIQINSKIFSILFRALIPHLLPIVKNTKKLRRGFLRGYFSADGGIGVKKDPKILNLSQLTFYYNTKTEQRLRDFVIDCLEKETIENISYSENDSGGYISIYNWKNYLKLWKIGLFNRNKRKREKFLNVVKEMRVYLDLKKSFRENIFLKTGLKQRNIAKLLKSWQGNISKVIKGIHLLNVNQINILIDLSNTDWNQVIENSTRLRIGNQTFLPIDYEFIKFVLSEKNLI